MMTLRVERADADLMLAMATPFPLYALLASPSTVLGQRPLSCLAFF
jgi:hypothetical protein